MFDKGIFGGVKIVNGKKVECTCNDTLSPVGVFDAMMILDCRGIAFPLAESIAIDNTCIVSVL